MSKVNYFFKLLSVAKEYFFEKWSIFMYSLLQIHFQIFQIT